MKVRSREEWNRFTFRVLIIGLALTLISVAIWLWL